MSGEPQPFNPQALAFLAAILAGDLLLQSRLPILKAQKPLGNNAPDGVLDAQRTINSHAGWPIHRAVLDAMGGEPQPFNPQALAFLAAILAGDLLLPLRPPFPEAHNPIAQTPRKQHALTATVTIEEATNNHALTTAKDFASFLFV
jgi:hypothetical protein